MVKNKKAAINSINKKDENCFQYAITVALNYEEIGKNPERITKIKPFINKCNWKEIEFPPHKNDQNKFESNNKTIAHNISYVPHNSEEIRHAYKSKHNLSRKNQVILLMIADKKMGLSCCEKSVCIA